MKICKSCNKDESQTQFAGDYRYCTACHFNYRKSRKSKRKNLNSEVYFVQSGDLIKIGFSGNVEQRIGSIQVNNPTIVKILKTIPGGYAEEQQLHKKFAHLNKTGEWFYAAQELLDFIETVDKI